MKILSTKKLEINQKQFLLNAGFSVVEADFIKTISRNFELNTIHNYLIFTSQNAVYSILKNKNKDLILNIPCFCVGIKTKQTLEQNGFKVIECTDYASELGKIIKEKYFNNNFTFFSGNMRRDTLPVAMHSATIEFNEICVYDTILTPHKISTVANGILFYSPSGIESYLKENTITNEVCFCIGTTTAEALKDRSKNIIIAKRPTVENVIIQSINYFKKNN